MVQDYDPDVAPPAEEWMGADDSDKLVAVMTYHRQARIAVANARLHAAIHVAVENQLALGEPVVVDTHARLQREGLMRHDSIHALGSVLVSELAAALESPTDKAGLASSYLSGLADLTALRWRNGGDV
ncbi:MAG: hypothetical protein ABI051_14485 [Vicinamibacterales bacterium]